MTTGPDSVCCVCVCVSHSVMSDCLSDCIDCSLSDSSVRGILQARILEWVSCPSPGGLPDQGTEPVSLEPPALTGRFFTPKLPGKPT